MDARAKADQGTALVRGLARAVTTVLEAGRGQLTSAATQLNHGSEALLDSLRESADDAIAYLDPAPWLEEVYAFLGIASSTSIMELDERVDDVELKVEEVARNRTREELMLLQQRIGELELILSDIVDGREREAMGGLLSRLTELESRIDALPLRRLTPDRSTHP